MTISPSFTKSDSLSFANIHEPTPLSRYCKRYEVDNFAAIGKLKDHLLFDGHVHDIDQIPPVQLTAPTPRPLPLSVFDKPQPSVPELVEQGDRELMELLAISIHDLVEIPSAILTKDPDSLQSTEGTKGRVDRIQGGVRDGLGIVIISACG